MASRHETALHHIGEMIRMDALMVPDALGRSLLLAEIVGLIRAVEMTSPLRVEYQHPIQFAEEDWEFYPAGYVKQIMLRETGYLFSEMLADPQCSMNDITVKMTRRVQMRHWDPITIDVSVSAEKLPPRQTNPFHTPQPAEPAHREIGYQQKEIGR